jgi:hypothetical protein
MRLISSLSRPGTVRATILLFGCTLFGSRAAVGQQPRSADFAAAVAGQVPPAPEAETDPLTGPADHLGVPAPQYGPGCCEPYAMDGACCADACCDPTWLDGCYGFVAIGGASIGAPLVNEDAFNWVVGASVPIHDTRLATLVAFDAGHDAATQTLATAGLAWAPDVWSCSPLDRIGVVALVQNYDDSQFRGADLWRSKIDISYAITPGLTVGAYSYDRIGEAEVDFSTDPFFSALFTSRMSEIRGAYITRDIGGLSLSFRAGYGNRPDAWRLGGTIAVQAHDDVSLYVSTDAHDGDEWGTVAGLQYDLFPDCRGSRSCCQTCPRLSRHTLASTGPNPPAREDLLRGGVDLKGILNRTAFNLIEQKKPELQPSERDATAEAEAALEAGNRANEESRRRQQRARLRGARSTFAEASINSFTRSEE